MIDKQISYEEGSGESPVNRVGTTIQADDEENDNNDSMKWRRFPWLLLDPYPYYTHGSMFVLRMYGTR